jgi:hypothetical protein
VKRYAPVLLAVVAAAGGVIAYYGLRGDASAGGDDESERAQRIETLPETRRLSSNDAPQIPAFRELSMDDDPIGPLRLEGIVIDEDEIPVTGAVVALNSNPPRTAVSGEDGSFYFTELVGRVYTLSARVDDSVGGPVIHHLSDVSDPVAIRVRQGATLEVTVVAEANGAPVVGATVGLYGDDDLTATTDERGVARLRAVSRGNRVLYASASGFARARRVINVPDEGGLQVTERMLLRTGAAVSGRVLDPNGKPVADAQVIAHDASQTFVPLDPRIESVATDKDGRFSIPSLHEGTYRFIARHTEHPPSSTDAIAIDGDDERADIVIVMEMGGVIAGRAVDTDGTPAPWATIYIAPDPAIAGGGTDGLLNRKAVAGEDGAFRVTGVARTQLVAMATTETAVSDLIAVDLRQAPAAPDVVLTLTIAGAIAGIVVDESGESIPEAQVVALPDFFKGEPTADLSVRGPVFATTDGGGRFTLRGMRDGAYRVQASRSSLDEIELGKGAVAANTGDTGVKVVLPRDGGIEGKVRLSNGSTPELVTVTAGNKAAVPATRGAFRIGGLHPGTYDIVFRGPEFDEKLVTAEVKSGAFEDMGTIEVAAGRAAKGRVVDAQGKPVEGASVVVARRMISDGNNLVPPLGAMFEERLGVRRATSDARGDYRVGNIGETEMVIAAEHDARGRAHAVTIPPGTEDATVELRLQPWGALQGIVTQNGEPVSSAGIYIAPNANPKQNISVEAGMDGKFSVPRLPAGGYNVSGGIGTGASQTLASKAVTVLPGKTANVELDIVTGDVKLAVEVTGEDGATIDAAQVFMFNGKVTARNAQELLKIFSVNASSGAKMAFAFPPKPAEFEQLAPGEYSVCVIPVNGDLSDNLFQERLQRHVDALLVYCKAMVVADSPNEQTYSTAVPPMVPLPE